MKTIKKHLSTEQKKLIIKIKEDNPGFSFSDVAEEFYKKTKVVVSVSSVSLYWRNRSAIKSGLPFNLKQPANISISEETILKIEEAEKQGKEISESNVIEFAQKIVLDYKLDPSKYHFSPEWARGICRGHRDDVSILKANRNAREETTSSVQVSLSPSEILGGGVERLVNSSPIQNASIIEENKKDVESMTCV